MRGSFSRQFVHPKFINQKQAFLQKTDFRKSASICKADAHEKKHFHIRRKNKLQY